MTVCFQKSKLLQEIGLLCLSALSLVFGFAFPFSPPQAWTVGLRPFAVRAKVTINLTSTK